MKNQLYIALLVVMMSATSCESDEGVLGDQTISVTTLIDKGVERGIYEVIAGQAVYLRLKSEPDSYLFLDTTDSSGHVEFEFLNSSLDYIITANRVEEEIPYTAKIEWSSGNESDELVLSIDDTQVNGFRIECVDMVSAGVPLVPLCMYLSPQLADSNDCSYSTIALTSNEFGIVQQLNIEAHTYSIRIFDTIAGIPVDVSSQITVLEEGIVEKSLVIF